MITGQRVVCVDDSFPPEVALYYKQLPKRNIIYTIRNVELGCNWNGEAGEVCVLLNELSNPKSEHPPYRERGFNGERFRPLTSSEEQKQEEMYAGIGHLVPA